MIYREILDLQRVSSGAAVTTELMEKKLSSGETGKRLFRNIVMIEAPHMERMTKERYVNVWRSVSDIQIQAGERVLIGYCSI